MTVETWTKPSFFGGHRTLTIVFDGDKVSYPQGVPLANNRPNPMTVEYARQAFAAYGYAPDLNEAVEQVIEAAENSPECFKCQKPITDLTEVRIVTVRIDRKPVSVWVHSAHSKPGDLA